ncbi:MAG: Trm112 family protein [Alphaproteobacteria bacterium]|nr:MAG: Trm112 family protein [Alphaproteobacteria bacterium]
MSEESPKRPEEEGALPPADAESGEDDIDPRLLEILVCPVTRGPLEYDRRRQELVSRRAGLAFPVRDGVPIMLVDEARRLDEA